jgi:RimJ/RimL family protein N-acetyltransferase
MNQNDIPSTRPLINIEGEKVALGPLLRELIPLYQKWDTDFEINRATSSIRPVTLEEETDAYDRYIRDKTMVLFTIYERQSFRPIGKTYLSLSNHNDAEFGIVIGEQDCQGKGYGTEATRLMLDYGFTILGLHNIMLTVLEYNIAGIKAYEKAGFRIIGRRRKARRMNGQLWDVIYMDCVPDEFESPVLGKLFIVPASASPTR